jgi:hypothetical protein
MVVVTAAVAATALAGTAASAAKLGLPGLHHDAAAPQWQQDAGSGQLTAGSQLGGVGSGSVVAATAGCVPAGASRTTLTHRFDAVHRVWVVHVAKILCQPLFVQDAQYRKPLAGHKDFPQHLAATGRLIRIQGAGNYSVPLVGRNTCVQTDTGAQFGSPPKWPTTLAALGVPQPQQLSHFSVGPNTWSSPPAAACAPFTPTPAPKVKANCPANCNGIATVTVTATNQTTNLVLQIAPVLNGVVQHNHILRLNPGATGSVSFGARDGSKLTFGFVYSSTSRFPFKPFGKAITIVCPPGAPPVTVTVNCPCAGTATGTISIANPSRYTVQVAVFVDGVRGPLVTVAAKHTGKANFAMPPRASATFGFRYQLNGVFQPSFAPIQLKVTAAG